jgi:predicted double-glycine peptidase
MRWFESGNGTGRRVAPSFFAIAIVSLLVTERPASAVEPVRSLLEMRHERVVIQTWDLSCGAAALTTILNYQFGDMVTEREVAIGLIGQERYLRDPDLVRLQSGFSLLDLKRYVESRGYVGVGLGGLSLADLVDTAPMLVPISRHGYDHFVVFRGVMGNRVLLADPAFGTVTMPVRRFERVWLDLETLGRVGFYVARANGVAPPADLAPRPGEFLTLR